jgi:hypothetical protein
VKAFFDSHNISRNYRKKIDIGARKDGGILSSSLVHRK